MIGEVYGLIVDDPWLAGLALAWIGLFDLCRDLIGGDWLRGVFLFGGIAASLTVSTIHRK